MEKRKDPWIQLYIADYRYIRAYCKVHNLRSAATIIDTLLAFRSLWRGPGSNERDLRLTREDCRDLGCDKDAVARSIPHLVDMGYLEITGEDRTQTGFRFKIYGLPVATVQGYPVHRDLRPTVASTATVALGTDERSQQGSTAVATRVGERSHQQAPLVPPECSGGGTSYVSQNPSHARSACRDPEGEKRQSATLQKLKSFI